LISGNGVGVTLNSAGNTVLGNFIGTDATGTAAIPNGNGVSIGSSDGNVVGGTTGTTPGGACTGACNLVSGNTGYGINVAQATNSIVQGNFIGVDVTGHLPLGNGNAGVPLFGGAGNQVGGTVPEARNVISNNFIGVSFNASNGHTIQGNFVGTDTT